MNADQIETVARKIATSIKAREQFKPLRGPDEPETLETAYEIQDAVYRIVGQEHAAGPIGGHKIAITSPQIQELCGVDQPIYGAVFANRIHTSPHTVSHDDFVRLGLEFEVGVTMGQDVPASQAPYDHETIVPFIKSVAPAFELIEDRNADYSDLDAKSLLTDLCWCGGVVLGQPVEDLSSLDLGDMASTIVHNGAEVAHGNVGDALGHPLNGLAWIANHLASRGKTLKAGDIIITGSALKTLFPVPGDSFSYNIDGLGSVSVKIADSA